MVLLLQLPLVVRVDYMHMGLGNLNLSHLVWVALNLLQQVAEALDSGRGEILRLCRALAEGIDFPGPD